MWSKNNAEWGMATHDWMVQNIDEMAVSLKEFVTRYYPANAGEVLNAKDPLEPYRALMFMGLQTSKFYKDKVDDAREKVFKTYQQDLASGTKNCP